MPIVILIALILLGAASAAAEDQASCTELSSRAVVMTIELRFSELELREAQSRLDRAERRLSRALTHLKAVQDDRRQGNVQRDDRDIDELVKAESVAEQVLEESRRWRDELVTAVQALTKRVEGWRAKLASFGPSR